MCSYISEIIYIYNVIDISYLLKKLLQVFSKNLLWLPTTYINKSSLEITNYEITHIHLYIQQY